MNGYCNFSGIGLIPYAPLHAGYLARPVNSEESRTTRHNIRSRRPGANDFSPSESELMKRVEEVAKQTGMSMAQVSIAWVGGKVTSPIVGISSVSDFAPEDFLAEYLISICLTA